MQSVWRSAGYKRRHLEDVDGGTGERYRFMCGICKERFKRKEHMKRHEVSHSIIKPLSCLICGLGFGRKDSLVAHTRKCAVKHEKQPPKTLDVECASLELNPATTSSSVPLPSSAILPSVVGPWDTPLSFLPTFEYSCSLETYSPQMHSNLMSAVYSQISTTGQTLDVSADTFYRYLQTYQQYPGYQQPILHHTLFSSYDHLKDFDTATEHVEKCVVLLFCAAIGAIYCSEPTTARKMRDVAKTALVRLLGQDHFKWEKAEDVESVLHVLQARLLCAVFDAWSGDRDLVEMALNEQLLWIRMCTKCTLSKFRRVTSDWRRWIVRESFHRVYWGCFSLISDFNMAYGDITPEPVVSTRIFPLPEADALWDAEDQSSWQQQISVCEAPLTADVIIAKIVGEVESGGHQRARESRFCEASAFATCVLLRFVMHHVSASEQVFNSQVLSKGLDPECEKITQYLRQLSGEQIDRLLADLSIRSMKFTHSPTKFSIESLIQSIELRRRRLLASKKLGVLCSILIESDRNQILGDFLSSKTMKSEQVCQAVTICLKYIEPYAVSGTRMRTFKELVCTWESVLLIIMWLRTMVNAGVHTETERSAVEQVKQTVAKFPAEAGVVEDGTAELARRMARVWRRVLQETQSYGTSYMMLQFFDQLADLL